MEQNQLIEGNLLDEKGHIIEAGYAYSLVKIYSRDQVKLSHLKIKEWDYYFISNQQFGVALTVADNSYMSLIGATFFDFVNKQIFAKNVMGFMSRGKFHMPTDSRAGDIVVENKKASFKFLHENNKRHLLVSLKNFDKNRDFRCDIYLEETCPDTMVIVTPFKKPGHFYYNQKINLQKASGYVKLGSSQFDFGSDSYGVLDWGRGIWTYKNTWYWSSLSGVYRGHRIGFNLGYGFGDTSKASENVFYYDDKIYKLDDVRFDIPLDDKGNDDFLKPWKFRSSKGDIDLTFTPIIDNKTRASAVIIKQIGDQVFGKFSGHVSIDDKIIYFEDLLGFAEKVTNYW